MIQFNTLSINPEGTELIIDVSVKSSMYYENIYIDKIVFPLPGLAFIIPLI